MQKSKNHTIYSMALMALFAALTAVFSQIMIPLGPIPINLALLAVFACGGTLGWKKGTASIALYIVLGLAGIPVFTGFQGGPAKIAGPTGGYILGYLFAVWIIGFFCDKIGRKTWILAFSMILGLAVCYLFGTLWFTFSTGTGIIESLAMCVLPYLPGDAGKIIAACGIVKTLEKAKLLPA